jgi:hypothetical protein
MMMIMGDGCEVVKETKLKIVTLMKARGKVDESAGQAVGWRTETVSYAD